MSSTRIAKPGTPPRQERFASGYERGLLGNLAAKRVQHLTPAQRAPLLFLQWLSWQPGRLEEVRRAIGDVNLERMCLDPGFLPADLWQAVADYRAEWIAARPPVVETTIGRRMADAIAFAQKAPALVLLQGVARIGKSFAAANICERSGGVMRYVATPPSNDEFSFIRAFALALGVSSSLKMKVVEMRARVEETLQAGGIGIVLDEAHYCFDSYLRSTSLPTRINWLMCALVNNRVPLVLVTTDQFHKAVVRLEKSTDWSSEQLAGRITYTERLPEKLPMPDLLAVARAIFPEGNTIAWSALAAYANLSETHLAAMTALASRARWHASQSGRANATADDLRVAMRETNLPGPVRYQRTVRQPHADMSLEPRDDGAVVARIGNRRNFTESETDASGLVVQ